MEIRKVQMTGGSSYIISLPKDWVRASHIEKNDPVGIFVQPDGSLTITPSISGRAAEKTKEIDLRSIQDEEYLSRLLIGTYVMGYNTIRITAAGRLPSFTHKAVRRFIQVTIGQEVSDQTADTITIRDLLNPGEMPFENTIRGMSVIVEGMARDAMLALTSDDRDLVDDVITRGHDVNRLYWLVARQFNLLLSNPLLSMEMGVEIGQAHNYLQIAHALEQIAGQVRKIADSVLSLMQISLDRRMLEKIGRFHSLSLEIFSAAMQAFFSQDITGCNAVISRLQSYTDDCNRFSQSLFNERTAGVIPIGNLIEDFRRIAEDVGWLSESSIYFLLNTDG